MSIELPAVHPAEGWLRYFAKLNRARVMELRAEMRGMTGDELIDSIGFAAWHTAEAKRLETKETKRTTGQDGTR